MGGPGALDVGDATDLVPVKDLESTELTPTDLPDRIWEDEQIEPTGQLTVDDLQRVDVAITSRRQVPRAKSVPPPIPATPSGRAARALLTPVGAIPVPPRKLPTGTIDGEAPVPHALGDYLVTGVLASGSMGVVYRGEHRATGRPVAVKVMRPKRQQNPADVARFFAEAVATARIDHPNVVRYHDFGHDERGAAYLVMELLEGETLSCRLARERRLDLVVALDIAIQIGVALAAAHQRGVVHRDIKPDNIFLCVDPARPGSATVKLLDFGVARVDDHTQGTMNTQQGDLLGTPSYMAPEQGLSASSSDARSDLYSVGCILFEMTCGVVPFAGNLVETLLAHQTSERPSARALHPEVPEALDALITRLLARDPADRPQSVLEVVQALAAIKSDARLATSSRQRARTDRITGGWLAVARRHPHRLLAAALVAIALGISLGVLLAG